MIATSIDTKDFSQIIPGERFDAQPPQTNPTLAASLLDVTQTPEGLAVSVSHEDAVPRSISVDNALQQVIVQCQKELDRHPESTRSRVNLALALMNGGQEDAGAGILEEVIRLNTNDYVALTSLALFLFRRGLLDKAEATYLRLHSAYPSDTAPLINLASIALRRENFLAASDFLQQAVAIDGCSVMAKYLLAMVLLRLGKHNQSVALLRRALHDGEQTAELNQGLAIAYLAGGDTKRAERCFLAALTIDPNMAAAVHGLAMLRLQCGRFGEVVDALVDHIGRTPTDTQARELLARAYVQMGHLSRARGQLQMLIPSNTEGSEAKVELARISNNIGFCFAHEGRTEDAEAWLKKSLSLDGKSSAAPYTNLARMYLSRGKFMDALSTLSRLDKTSLENPDSAMLKSAALVNLQKHDEAIQVLQELINTDAAPSSSYAELGWLLADWKEEYGAAIAVLREGYARDATNPVLLNNLAYVHLMRGEPEFARPVLEQIPATSANQIVPTATQGLLLLWEGDISGGENLYKKAETMAAQSGQKALAVSVRQKRHLEMSRAYMRAGQSQDALRQLKIGLAAKGGQTLYRYFEQLLEVARHLALPEAIS